MKVPLVDLRASLEPIKKRLFEEFEHVLDGMQLFLGPNVQAFEKEFADFCEVRFGAGVSSGTDALVAALRACGIGPGDEVIVPAMTFFATVSAVAHTGATPVLVDVEPRNLTLDPEAVRAAVTSASRAVVPVHLYGHPADMDPILALAAEHDLRVIEDCAQAHGARYKGRRCGSMGDAGCFSFYFTKNLGAFGEAGFITSNSADVAERVRLLRDHGHASKFEHSLLGYNMRLDELQAAVLRLKLPLLEQNSVRRRAIAARYDGAFAGSGLQLLAPRDDCEAVYHLYAVRSGEPDALRERLGERGVGTGIHYKIPCHQQPALASHPHRVCAPAVAEQAGRTLLSLPMYPELTDEQVDYVIEQVQGVLQDAASGAGKHVS